MKKIISVIAALVVSAASITSSFAADIYPMIGSYGNSIVNDLNTDIVTTLMNLNTAVKDGKLTISRTDKGYENNTYFWDSGIKKTVDIPQTGKTEINMGFQAASGDPAPTIELFSGDTRVMRVVFGPYNSDAFVRRGTDNSISYSTANKWNSFYLHQSGSYAIDNIELDYNSGLMKISQQRGNTVVPMDLHYKVGLKDDGTVDNSVQPIPAYTNPDDTEEKYYTSNSYATELTVGENEKIVLGLPFDTTLKIDNMKIFNRNDGAMRKGAWFSIDYLNITNYGAEDAVTPIVSDDFNDSTKMMYEYGYTLASNDRYYYNTDNGFGFFFGLNNYPGKDAVMKFNLDEPITSGKVVVEFTTNAWEIAEDGTKSVFNPATANLGNNFFDVYGANTTKTFSASVRGGNGEIFVGTGADAVDYANQIATVMYKDADGIYERDYKFIFDLDNHVMQVCYYKDNDGKMATFNRSFPLTANEDGTYSISGFSFATVYNPSKNKQSIEYKNINVYKVDETTKAMTPVFFDADMNEVTSAEAGEAVTAYIPVADTTDTEINYIVGKYISDGTFVDCVAPVNLTNKKYELVKVPFVVSANAASGDYIKTFIWDNLTNICPFVASKMLTVE